MTAQSVDGGKIIFDYKLDENYLLHLTVKAESMQKYLLPTSKVMGVEWERKTESSKNVDTNLRTNILHLHIK